MARKKTTEERAELSVKSWELRKAGVPYGKIGRQLGVSSATIYRYIQDQLKQYTNEIHATVQDTVTLELARLDDMYLAIWSKARGGDNKAIELALKVMERRAKLLGLDTPVATKNVNVNVSNIDITSMSDENRIEYLEGCLYSMAPMHAASVMFLLRKLDPAYRDGNHGTASTLPSTYVIDLSLPSDDYTPFDTNQSTTTLLG